MRTCNKCDGEGLLYETPGEPWCDVCNGIGDIADGGSRLPMVSAGDPPFGDRRGFKTGDRVKLKHSESYCVGTIREDTRYKPTDGKGPVFHFSGEELSSVASCVVRPHEIERCDKHGVSLFARAILGQGMTR